MRWMIWGAALMGLGCADKPPASPPAQPGSEAAASMSSTPSSTPANPAGTPAAPPGATPRDAIVNARLAAALTAKGAAYTPRTHHLTADGRPKYINRLIGETSPYLLQHAHNPVDWHAWGDAAFALASRLDRPILLSIGYSTCHWCHVMERESFEDAEIAAYINAHFIAIKVDREERPDVDSVYMHAARMLSGGNGGWPMTIVMTPDKQPFFGGTYFPARTGDRGSRKGFFAILKDLSARYATDKAAVVAEAAKNTRRLQAAARPPRPMGVPGPEAIERTVRFYAKQYDARWGGFGRRPKFPRPVTPALMLRYHRRTGDAKALQMVTHTLRKMHAGGMYDHVGGGFHRYSVDGRWHVPHFEKMLYDNAQLIALYTEAWQATGDAGFATVARESADYILREMTDPAGGFYSATDADSARPDGHMEEGYCFTWTPAEIDALLDADAARVVKAWFQIDARGDLDGRNVLNTPRPAAQVAAQLGRTVPELMRIVDAARPVLYAARGKRPPPLKDTKIIAAWNGMMIHALAQAGPVLGEPRYVQAAAKAADFILAKMRVDGDLRRTFKDGEARNVAVLDDYAFVIEGLLSLFEATGEARWLTAARALQARLDAAFVDPAGGYFLTPSGGEALLVREKPDYDGARPTGNSTAALNLLRLAELTGAHAYRAAADKTLAAFARPMARGSMPKMLAALDFALDRPREVVIVAPDAAAAKGLLDTLRRTYLPNRIIVPLIGAPSVDAKAVPLVEAKVAMDGKATAYVCEAGRCERPTHDPKVFAAQLGKVHPLLSDRSPDPL